MHSKMKGNLGELSIAKDLVRQGYQVFRELGDLSKIDLIAVDEGYYLFKIQVKAVTPKKGIVAIDSRKSGPGYSFRYQEGQVDIFAVHVLGKDIVLYLSAKELLTKKATLAIRIEKSKNSQRKNVNWYEDYLDLKKAINKQQQAQEVVDGTS